MQGSETFKIAVRAMADISLKTIEKSGMILSDIDCFVPHQANARIIEAVAKRLGLDMGKVLVNLDSYGNTSAASVPAALDEGIRSGRLKPGDNIALTSFGGGMAWGGAVITL
jgi:3-oxoacyl-[acyl-carrier-protein] synthase-3